MAEQSTGSTARIRLRCAHLVTPTGTLTDGVVVIDGDTITEVRSFTDHDLESGEPIEKIDGWVLPGFVDTHTHGGAGRDLGSTDSDDIRAVAAFARRHGATSIFASLVTAELTRIEDQLRTLGPLVAAGEIAGIHAEGPFLSPERRGAHDPRLLRHPEPEAVDRILTAADGRLSMITIAPELPGAPEAISRFVDNGVAVAIGHTDADDRIVAAAVDAGARVATHLFNAMPPIHHRHPGPIPLLLTDPRVTVELIMDGVHLHPEVLAMAVAAAGPDRVAMVTDAMVATGMDDGDYRLGDLEVAVEAGVARLRTADGSVGSIAGSTLTMQAAFGYAVQTLGLSITDVAAMAATTPARTHRLDSVGTVEPGRRADLVVVDDQGNLHAVMAAGQWEDRQ
ncbi:N-acetylglucosamine-6-phosphate deacetylase [Microlunatus soli]|nr:N-acetylglucosamine-6-phosphate deacetylase [Microlunatus soli]